MSETGQDAAESHDDSIEDVVTVMWAELTDAQRHTTVLRLFKPYIDSIIANQFDSCVTKEHRFLHQQRKEMRAETLDRLDKHRDALLSIDTLLCKIVEREDARAELVAAQKRYEAVMGYEPISIERQMDCMGERTQAQTSCGDRVFIDMPAYQTVSAGWQPDNLSWQYSQEILTDL